MWVAGAEQLGRAAKRGATVEKDTMTAAEVHQKWAEAKAAARAVFEENRKAYAVKRIADLAAESFPDCRDCGNPCDFEQTQCPACLEVDARAAWADDQNDERDS